MTVSLFNSLTYETSLELVKHFFKTFRRKNANTLKSAFFIQVITIYYDIAVLCVLITENFEMYWIGHWEGICMCCRLEPLGNRRLVCRQELDGNTKSWTGLHQCYRVWRSCRFRTRTTPLDIIIITLYYALENAVKMKYPPDSSVSPRDIAVISRREYNRDEQCRTE